MPRLGSWLALVGCAAACGWSEVRFVDEGVTAVCEAAAACAGSYDAATCEARVRATDLSGCDYDPGEAEACADDVAAASCEPAGGVFADVPVLVLPASCAAVYDCAWITLDPPM